MSKDRSLDQQSEYRFETVDVFTNRPFGGNPLAVFPDARGLSDGQMQSLAAEFNLSETAFVLPPVHTANTARVRIFNRTAEMSFAGHPCIGTAFVLGNADHRTGDVFRFEVPAGVVLVDLQRGPSSEVVGACLEAPQPLRVGAAYTVSDIAQCVGITPGCVLQDLHPPVEVSVGNTYVVAQVTPDALSRCVPDLRTFANFRASHPELGDRFSLHLYSIAGHEIRARMFAPLAGTVEDPATGSANAPLAALLLSLGTADHAEYRVSQGQEMGRPSELLVTATRRGKAITATVAGTCVRMLSGVVRLPKGNQ